MLSAETSRPFVGRTRELGELDQWFEDESARLLTLLGPAGVGKTTLLARWCQERSPGVVWVDLAPLSQAQQGLWAIASALQVELQGLSTQEQQLDQLSAILQVRGPLILALDNMEHLPDMGQLVAQLLEQAPTLRVVVTSRLALELSAERCQELRPLEPELARQLYLAKLPRALTQEDHEGLEGLLARLDGLPLALELAAAQRDFFTVRELSGALDEALGVLAGEPTRHGSLERALWPSWRRLSEQERELMASLSVWPGPFGLEHAQLVSGQGRALLWRSLKALHAQSMVSRAGEQLRLLWGVRQFVQEQVAPERLEQARQRMHEGLAALGQALFEQMGTPSLDEAMAQIQALMPALFAQLEHGSLSPPRRVLGVVLLGIMFERGHMTAAQFEALCQSVEGASGADPRHQVQLLFQRAASAQRSGRSPLAYALLDQAQAQAQQHGLERQRGHAYRLRGFLRTLEGPSPEAAAWFDRAIEIGQQTQDHDLLGLSLFYKAWCIGAMGRYAEALPWSQQSVSVLQEHGSPTRLATARMELGALLSKNGLWHEGHEQLSLAKQVLDTSNFVISLGTLEGAWAQHFVSRGDLEAAHQAAERAIEIFRQRGYPRMEVTWQIYQVGWWAQQRRWEQVIRGLTQLMTSSRYERAGLTLETLRALQALALWATSQREQLMGYMEQLRPVVGRCGALLQQLLRDVAAASGVQGWPEAAEVDDDLAWRALACWRSTPAAQAALAAALEVELRCRVEKVAERFALGLCGEPWPHEHDPGQASAERGPKLRWSGEEIVEVELEVGQVVSLRRRAPMRRILTALVRLAQRDERAELTVWEAFEAGWPGERVAPEVASHRVYVAMSRLRGLGLGELVQTTGDGYRWAVEPDPS